MPEGMMKTSTILDEKSTTIFLSEMGAGDDSYSININKSNIILSVISLNNPLDEFNKNEYFVNISHKDSMLLDSPLNLSQNEEEIFANLNVDCTNFYEVSEMINNPIFICVHEISNVMINDVKSKKPPKKGVDIDLKTPLGCCNVDLFPLVDGTESLIETLELQPVRETIEIKTISSPLLPMLTIKIIIEHPNDCEILSLEKFNLLDFTVESVYNVPAQVGGGTYDCLAYSIVPKYEKDNNEVLFSNGCPIKNSNVNTYKKWGSLDQVTGPANMSTYKLLDIPILNPNNIDISSASDSDLTLNCCRVQWDQLHRLLIDESDTEVLNKYITDEHFLPLEIALISKQVVGGGKSTTRRNTIKTSSVLHYMAFVDISRLIYPGVCAIRVACPIYKYNEKHTPLHRWEAEMFLEEKPKSDGKTTAESLITPSTASLGSALFDNSGNPLFIVIQIEMAKPLQIKKNIEDVVADINKLIPTRKVNVALENAQTARTKFKKCIQETVSLIKEEYPKFIEAITLFSFQATGDDEMSAFMKYLYQSGVYNQIMSSFTSNIISFINNNYKIDEPFQTMLDYQNLVSTVYVDLMQDVNKIINTMTIPVKNPCLKCSDLVYYAREADALGDIQSAEQFYMKYISINDNPADSWFNYSVFCLGCQEYEKAYIAVLETLQCSSRYQYGLLFCGVLLILRDRIKDAENFFTALVTIYPLFIEGWVATHLYYKLVEDYDGAAIALEMAYMLATQEGLQTESNFFMLQDELVWYDSYITFESIFMKSAALFMRLRCLEFTELALEQELATSGTSLTYIYFLATFHYFQGRYSDSLSLIEEAISLYGNSYYLNSLEGHCHTKLQSYEKATQAFELSLLPLNSPDDKHLVFILLGHYYFSVGNYELAKQKFIACCNFNPSPVALLGAATAFYKIGSLEDCEACLKEANYADPHNPVIWAYLCILHLTLGNKNDFKTFYIMALKNNLKDEKLLSEIKALSADVLVDDGFSFDNSFIF